MQDTKKYIALFRGINVGGKNKVEMKRLKKLFELIGFENVASYINSGNIKFESEDILANVWKNIEVNFKKEFGFDVPILVKSHEDIIRITDSIPHNWQNNTDQKTDVAYLFPDIDSTDTIEQLPVNRAFIDVRYTPGAIYWNVDRKDQNKSKLNKLVGHKLYQFMTVRNVNTARYLATWND